MEHGHFSISNMYYENEEMQELKKLTLEEKKNIFLS